MGSAAPLAAAMATASGMAAWLHLNAAPASSPGDTAFTAGPPRQALRHTGAIRETIGHASSSPPYAREASDLWTSTCLAPFAGAAAAIAAAAVTRRPRPCAPCWRAAPPDAPEPATEDLGKTPVPVLVVNLDKSVDRWEKSREELSANGITAERFSATLGKAMTDEELQEKTTFGARYFCTPGMIGCFMSHLRIWQRTVEEGLPAVVVLEDDVVVLHSDFNRRLQVLLDELPDDWDVCLLGAVGCIATEREALPMKVYGLVTGGGRASPGKTRSISPNIYVPYRPAGTHAYMISQRGAAKLLRLCPKPRYHVDLTAWSIKELNLYAAREQLATQRFDDDTTVSKQGAPLTKRFLRWCLDVSGLAYMGRRGGVPNLQWGWTIAVFALPIPFGSTRKRLIVEMGPSSSLFVLMVLACIPFRSFKPLGFGLAYLTSMICMIRWLAGTQKPLTLMVMALLSAAVIYFG